MKVVCIDTDFTNKLGGSPTLKLEEPLDYGKVYEASLVFFIKESEDQEYSAIDWDNNYLNLEGYSELDWFPTKNFVTLDEWRQKVLDEIL